MTWDIWERGRERGLGEKEEEPEKMERETWKKWEEDLWKEREKKT